MKFYSPKTILILFSILCFDHLFAQNKMAAVKVVVAGTSHGHVAWILNRPKDSAIEIVGIYEPSERIPYSDALPFSLN